MRMQRKGCQNSTSHVTDLLKLYARGDVQANVWGAARRQIHLHMTTATCAQALHILRRRCEKSPAGEQALKYLSDLTTVGRNVGSRSR